MRSPAQFALVALTILIASWQVTARSEDPNAVALSGTVSIMTRTGGDLNQYRPLSHYIAVGLQTLQGSAVPPYELMRFGQCLLIFSLAFIFYGQLGLHFERA